jgi:hypothetical protein
MLVARELSCMDSELFGQFDDARRDQTYSSDQTIRNTNFTGIIKVTGGNVVFEFCSFTAQPLSAIISPSAALQQFNGGDACGTVTCNWCDFDSGLRGNQGNFETEAFNAGESALSGDSIAIGD